jgi:hypothetical protein
MHCNSGTITASTGTNTLSGGTLTNNGIVSISGGTLTAISSVRG